MVLVGLEGPIPPCSTPLPQFPMGEGWACRKSIPTLGI